MLCTTMLRYVALKCCVRLGQFLTLQTIINFCREFGVRIHLFAPYYSSGGIPIFTQQPSSPKLVDEGKNLTLQWTYNIDRTLKLATFTDERSGGGGIVIMEQDSSGLFVKSSYVNRLRVNSITESETSITLLTVHRSDSGNYRFEVVNNNREKAISDVEVSVQCKYRKHFIC